MKYRLRAEHVSRTRRAFVFFDVVGGGLDLVSAWQIEHGTVTLGMSDTLYDPLAVGSPLGNFVIEVEGIGRGLVMQRPTWMDDDLPTAGELRAPTPELER